MALEKSIDQTPKESPKETIDRSYSECIVCSFKIAN